MIEEVNALPKPQSQASEEVSKDEPSVEVIEEQIDSNVQVKDKNEPVQIISTEKENQQVETQGETVKTTVEESSEEKPLTSPPRKSARLSAKRRDSTNTDSDISVTTKPESPLPIRRSLRRNSTSSQDATPVKAKDESTVKKLPTIVETTDQADGKNKQTTSSTDENETQTSEKALVDELAAAFVEEFIDDDE